MKRMIWLPCIVAAMGFSCAGEIENPEDFREARGAVTTADAGDEPSEAGRGASGRGSGAAGVGAGPAPSAAGSGGTDWEDDAGTPLAGSGGAGAGAAGDGSGAAGNGAAGRGGAGSPAAGSGGAGSPAAGSGGGSGGAGMMPPTPSCDFRGLVMMKCAGASCHGGPTASTGLDLTSPSLAMRVQGRTASGACSDTLLVDRDNPEESALYQRVTGSDCGVRMPLGGTLTPAEQACFLSWIEGL